jgi:hypothetical protein
MVFKFAHLDLSTEPREGHAQYAQSWLKVLRADKHAIFTATSKAQHAIRRKTRTAQIANSYRNSRERRPPRKGRVAAYLQMDQPAGPWAEAVYKQRQEDRGTSAPIVCACDVAISKAFGMSSQVCFVPGCAGRSSPNECLS